MGRITHLPAGANTRLSQELSPSVSVEQLVALRGRMLRFARLHLRSPETAEDLVQDTIEAALRGASPFAGRSSLKTWVFGILKNRIADHIRQAGRTVSLSSMAGDGEDWQEQLERVLDEPGQCTGTSRPTPWPDPEQASTEREFWCVFEACLDHLPTADARVFIMREVLGFNADETCRRLGISARRCHTMLHRARLTLRDCMEARCGRSRAAMR